jgi:hypothetical protein
MLEYYTIAWLKVKGFSGELRFRRRERNGRPRARVLHGCDMVRC